MPEPEAGAKSEVTTTAGSSDNLDFNDPKTQEIILHPDGTDVELSYGSIRLYPPSAMIRKIAYGFCNEIVADALETRPSSKAILSMRIAARLMKSPAFVMQTINLTAYLCGRPGKIDDAKAIELGTEIAEKSNPDDMALLFASLCSAAGINLDPKKKQPLKKD